MVETLAAHQNKIDEYSWHDHSQTAFEEVEMLLQEYEFCIEHFQIDNAKKDAQQNYIKLCNDFSRYARLYSFKRKTVEYGEKATSKSSEWSPEATTSFGKRRLPRPEPFKKKQKMFTK
jgi:hypothetical protein